MAKAHVTLFKKSGKYYTEEEWEIPEDAIGPYDMVRSPNFRRIDNGAVLVDTQEPWGYPHLLPSPVRCSSVVYSEGSAGYLRCKNNKHPAGKEHEYVWWDNDNG